jgi:Flp pilus assembly protein TadD
MAPDSKLLAAGMRHYRARDFEQAHKIYSQLLADNPRDPVILDLLGAVCIQLGQCAEAAVNLA